MELKQKIILKYLEGKSQRRITKELRTCRQTVNKYIEEYNLKKFELLQNDILKNPNEIIEDIIDSPKYDSSSREKTVVTEEVLNIIEDCLLKNKEKRAKGQRKQTMKATDIHELLISEGFDISYPSVAQTVNKLLNKAKEAFIKQEYALGDVCEFDWGEAKLNIDGKGYRKYQMAVFTSACGNYRYSVLFGTQDTIAFQQSHALFFEHVGRVYNTLVYDNMKVAVARFVGRNEKEPTENLLKLSIYYGFEFRFCNIRAGNEKGHVERSVEYLRRKAFAFKDTFNSLEEANEYLLRCVYEIK